MTKRDFRHSPLSMIDVQAVFKNTETAKILNRFLFISLVSTRVTLAFGSKCVLFCQSIQEVIDVVAEGFSALFVLSLYVSDEAQHDGSKSARCYSFHHASLGMGQYAV